VLVWFRISLVTFRAKKYNYIFVVVKVIHETLLVPFFLDTVYIRENNRQSSDLVQKLRHSRQRVQIVCRIPYYKFLIEKRLLEM